MKALRIREKPWSKVPAYQVRQYLEGVTCFVEGLEPFKLAELVSREIDSMYWGEQVSVQEVINRATLSALVKIVGNDWSLYDRIVSTLRQPHNKDLASMKLLAIGDPKYRIAAAKEMYLRRRPWVSSMSLQTAMEGSLKNFPWFESLRIDAEDMNVYRATLNITGGVVKLIIRFLTGMDSKTYVQLALDCTQVSGEKAILIGVVYRQEVVGLTSGDIFDQGENANLELAAIKSLLNQLLTENQDEFYFETFVSPEKFIQPQVYQPENLRGFSASSQESSIPDSLPAKDTGATQDCYLNLVQQYPNYKQEGEIPTPKLQLWLQEYQRGMHQVGLHDMERILLQNGIRVLKDPTKINKAPRVFLLVPDKLIVDKVRGAAAKNTLPLEARQAINKFADSFYVAMTKLQVHFGGVAHAFSGSSTIKPLFDLRPRSCWILASEGKTRWHIGFTCKNRQNVEAALRRMSGWVRRNLGKGVRAYSPRVIKGAENYIGSQVIEAPINVFLPPVPEQRKVQLDNDGIHIPQLSEGQYEQGL